MPNQVYESANFDVISGDLEDGAGRPTWAEPYKIYETALGIKIVFLAYTFPCYLTYHPGSWRVLDPITYLKHNPEIPEVKSTNLHILLSRLGLSLGEKVTTEVPEVDLIIGAYMYHVFEDGARFNGTYLAAVGKYG